MVGMTKELWVKRRENGNGGAWNKGMKFPELTGAGHPRWSSVELKCRQCEKTFLVQKHREKVAKFCSHDCAHKNRDEGKRTALKKIRQSTEYKNWRESIFKRDSYRCVACGDGNYEGRGATVVLNADHIKPFAHHPDLRFSLENGRTLCEPCHKATDTFGGKARRCVGVA